MQHFRKVLLLSLSQVAIQKGNALLETDGYGDDNEDDCGDEVGRGIQDGGGRRVRWFGIVWFKRHG